MLVDKYKIKYKIQYNAIQYQRFRVVLGTPQEDGEVVRTGRKQVAAARRVARVGEELARRLVARARFGDRSAGSSLAVASRALPCETQRDRKYCTAGICGSRAER